MGAGAPGAVAGGAPGPITGGGTDCASAAPERKTVAAAAVSSDLIIGVLPLKFWSMPQTGGPYAWFPVARAKLRRRSNFMLAVSRAGGVDLRPGGANKAHGNIGMQKRLLAAMCPARRRPRLPSGLYGSSRRLPNAPSKRSTPITARKIAVATLIETPAKGCCPLKSICRKSEKHSRLSATTTLLKKGRSDWPERTCRKSHGLFALVKRGR